MKLTQEQLQLASSCASAEELCAKAQDAGFDITQEQAKLVFDAVSVEELSEDSLDTVAGGCCTTVQCYYCKTIKRCYREAKEKWESSWHSMCDSCYEKKKNDSNMHIRKK